MKILRSEWKSALEQCQYLWQGHANRLASPCQSPLEAIIETAPAMGVGDLALNVQMERRRLPTVSVVIPTFNEAGNIAELLGRLDAALAAIPHEIIFVDDDSADGTSLLVRQFAARFAHVRCIRRVGRRGLSGACIEGVLSSSAAYVVVMDADLQHDETCIPAMVRALADGEAELVIASRYAGSGSADALGSVRGAISRSGTRVAQWLLAKEITDPLSGFFAVRRERFEAIAHRLSPAGFKILLDVLLSSPASLKVKEHPYRFRRRFAGNSKLDVRVTLDFAGLLLSKVSADVLGPRFVSFCLVGAGGLLIHLASLRALMSLAHIRFTAAQAGASLMAMSVNFLINNAITYGDRRLSGAALLRGYVKFCLICSVGVFANVGTAAWLYSDRVTWWGAGLTGALMAAVWNYTLSTEFVWGRPRRNSVLPVSPAQPRALPQAP